MIKRISLIVTIAAAALVGAGTFGRGQPSPAATSGLTPSKNYNQAVANYVRRPVHQVVGGISARGGEIPWQVSLEVSWIADPLEAHYCGGTIYSASWIITAAHCVAGLKLSDVVVAAGTIRLAPGAARVNIDDIIVHPGYIANQNPNDIALVHLRTPLKFGQEIAAIPLSGNTAEAFFVSGLTKFTVSGWGAEKPDGLAVSNLMKAQVPFASPEACTKAPSYPPDPVTHKAQITDGMLCAGDASGGVDSCQGDSGGPLVLHPVQGPAVLVGVVSWGEGCAQPYKYGVYTRVSRYADWIRETAI
jgi:secreted trypsin-like serine protease